MHIRALFITLLLLTPNLYAEDTVSFTFAPPPVTKPQTEGTSDKLTLSMVSIDSTAGGIDLSMSGWDIGGVSRQTNEKIGFSGQGHIGRITDDDDTIDSVNMGFSGNVETYLTPDKGTIVAGGLVMEFGNTTVDMGPSVDGSVSTLFFGFQLSAQSRLPINEMVGVTPYVLYKSLTGTADSTFGGSTTSTDVDVSALTFGVDVDIMQFSVAAMIQSTDDTDVTMFTLGINF